MKDKILKAQMAVIKNKLFVLIIVFGNHIII